MRARLLDLAERDADVAAAAITGSHAAGTEDEWSDVDVALGIRGPLRPAIERWTETVDQELHPVHRWDLVSGPTVYRVFHLPDGLQVDIAFTPEDDFGPRGPNWRTVFGETVDASPPPPSRDELVGWALTMCLNARASIARGKPWQAEYMISGVRDHVIALACLRLGHPTRFAKGSHLLPAEITGQLQETLVRSLDEAELRRALAAAATALTAELERTDAGLAERLKPTLRALS